MKKILLLICLALSASCALTNNHARDPQSGQVSYGARSENFWEQRIRKKMEYYDSMKFESEDTTITQQILDKNFIDQFKSEQCRKSSHEDCINKFSKMMNARMGIRYHLASKEAVDAYLEGYPEFKDKPIAVEALYIESHNNGVEQERSNWIKQEKEDANRQSFEANQ